jgi:hypothetical protein
MYPARKCSKCKETKTVLEFNTRPDRASGFRSECKKCQYARQYKREKANRKKVKAKHVARIAMKEGKLQKPLFCEKCKQVKPLDRHHPDYKKPKKVMWLCRKCHGKEHAELKRA